MAVLGALVASLALTTSSQPQDLPPHNWLTPPAAERAPTGRIVYMTGNTFLAQCENSRVACVTYLQGVNDALFSVIVGTSRDMPYCMPERATPEQMADVVIAYLRAHPGRRHLTMPGLMANALADVWPQCGR